MPSAARGILFNAPSPLHGALRTTYEPVDAVVRPGQAVTAGTPLGTLAALPLHCPAACLHLGLRRGETYLDPLSRLRETPPVLLPLGRP